jgi:hypothetical protein
VRRLFAVLSLLALALAGPSARATELRLEGDFLQGGLVFGQAAPGSEVTLDGRRVRVTEAGRFIFGFGRDAAPNAVLKVAWPDGRVDLHHLVVAKRDYRIQRIDGLPPKMVTPPEAVLTRIRAENARIAEARAVDRAEPLFESGFVWPALGPISGVFGSQRVLNGEPRRPHYGVDVAAPPGTPVTAPADGVVAIAHPDMYYTGGTVVLDHGHGLTSVYSHLQEVWASEGARLRQGDPIGSVGATGRATGPHLDWRINWFDQRLDPALLVPPMPEPAQ